MRDAGGFEGNGQTLRILSRLENFSQNSGANLCRRTLLGVLKYPTSFSQANNKKPALDNGPTSLRLLDVKASMPPKCYLDSENDVVDWILEPLNDVERIEFQSTLKIEGKHHKPIHKSLDCTIMDEADDVSYGVHDLEDAIALGLLTREEFEASVSEADCASFLNALKEKYPNESGNDVYKHFVGMLFGESKKRKRCISRLVHHFVSAIEIYEAEKFSEPLVRYRARLKAPQRAFLDALHKVVREEVIFDPSVQHLEFKGQKMVVSVFEALASDPKRLLPRDAYARFIESEKNMRVICDHVAGMTDTYLLRTYERLFSPRMGSIFDKL
jgi:dGTPase